MALAAGTKAPDFAVNDENGKTVKLSDYKGKKVILYFYPRDMTSGCTAEACSLRDNYKLMQKQGYVVLGVSTDDEKSHRKFIEKESLPFSLLADTDKAVHTKYETWIQKSMYGRKYMGTARITYVIDENGVISEVIEKVDTKNHASQILGTGPGTAPAKKALPRKEAARQTPAKKAAKKVVAKKATRKTAKKKR